MLWCWSAQMLTILHTGQPHTNTNFREYTVTICSLITWHAQVYSTQHYKGLSIFYRQLALIMQPTPRIPESPYTMIRADPPEGTSQYMPSKNSPPGHNGNYAKNLSSSVQDLQPIPGNNAVGSMLQCILWLSPSW